MPLTPAQEWRLEHFGTASNSGLAADDADPDGDGIVNLLERAFDGDPGFADPEILPAIDDTASFFSITYRKSVAATDLTITVQESTDLETWIPSSGTPTLLTNDGAVQEYRFTRPPGANANLYLRVKVQ
ncbi:MAG: hypothetical protein PVJ98_00390 [Akkermansiaceae bacterium]